MPQLFLLDLQVAGVVLVVAAPERHPLHHLEPVAAHRPDLAGVVGEQPQLAHAQVVEDLGPHAVVAQVGREAQRQVGLDRVQAAVLQVVGLDLVDQADAAPFLAQVDEHPAPLLGDALHGQVALEAAVAAQAVQGVAGQALGVHPHQHGFLGVELAHHQRRVLFAGDPVAVTDDAKLAELGGQHGLGLAGHEAVAALEPVADKALDRADLEPVTFGEGLQLGQPRHLAVFLHDLDQRPDRLQARQAQEVDGGLGVAGAPQHPALAGHQREDVAGTAQVGRGRARLGQKPDRGRPLGRRDAGGAALGVHAHGEGGAVRVGVALFHGRQLQRLGPLGGQGHAEQPPRLLDREVDQALGGELGRKDEVALVLAPLVVHHDHGLAVLQVLDDRFDGVNHVLASSSRST